MTPMTPRLFAGRCVYWLIWGPFCAVFIPFAAIGAFVDWLSFRAFPAIAELTQPLAGAVYSVALGAGKAVWGRSVKPSRKPEA